MANNAPFPIQPKLTAIAIGYRNPSYIAEEVLPRSMVATQEFKYLKHTKEEGFTVPDTKVGRRGQPNEITFTATESTDQTSDYGLDDPVPQADIDNAPVNYDPLGRAVEGLAELIALDREKRVADKVFLAATYPAANKVTLAGTDQWSDYVDVASDPIEDITVGLETPLVRPNTLVFGRAAYSKLARHPKIMKAVHGNEGDKGIARRQQIAELFEVEKVLVGDGWINTAKKGQAAVYARIWGKHAALLHINPQATTGRGITFGLSAQWGTRIAGSERDSKIGLRGGERVRVGESLCELITASDVGYFIENAVA